jgi:threonine aldolase
MGWTFYDFIGLGGYRLMCSWTTTDAEVDAFVKDAHATAATAHS